MFFKFKKASLELKDKGFLLADSLLSLMMLIIITSILLPALIVLVQYDTLTKDQLEFNRQLYIAMNIHDDFDQFKDKNNKYLIGQDEICDKEKKELCVHFNR